MAAVGVTGRITIFWLMQELSHWIDLVFGYKQTGQEAKDAVNVFHPATYPTNQTQETD